MTTGSSDASLRSALDAVANAEPGALDRLMPLLYARLRALAHERFADERPGHTLQPTALVNEIYLRLFGERQQTWRTEDEFFTAAAHAMRRVLIDHARARHAEKRGGGRARVALSALSLEASRSEVDILALDDALQHLAAEDPIAARIVELRFFAGLEFTAIARVIDVAERTVRRHWVFAKAWLLREMFDAAEPTEPGA